MTGLLIKIHKQDSEIILSVFSRYGLFPSITNNGLFLGQNAQPIKNQIESVYNIIKKETGIDVNIIESEKEVDLIL
jgi:hypothetical protein